MNAVAAWEAAIPPASCVTASVPGRKGERRPFIPSWHDPADLARALTAIARSPAHAARQHVADFLLPRLPRWVLASDTLKTDRPSSARRPMARAWKAKWISLNTRTHVNAITSDLDHTNWREELLALSEQGIPDPTWVTWNPVTDHPQVTWVLPIGARRDNPAQMRLVEGIRARLNVVLSGDPQFKNWLVRNPLHPDNALLWFSGETVELSAMLDPLIAWADPGTFILLRPRPDFEAQMRGLSPGIAAIPKTRADAIGPKGSRVWEAGRQRVYAARTSDLNAITAILQDAAAELASPIKASALAGMAKRISAWMANQPWATGAATRDARPGIDHGVMTEEADARGQGREWREMDREAKLPLSAERTNAKRSGKTAEAIARGLSTLAREMRDVTQPALAEASGLSLRTIERAWHRPLPAHCQHPATRSYPFSRRRQLGGPTPQGAIERGGNPVLGEDGMPSVTLWDAAVAITRRSQERRQARAVEDAAISRWNEQAARMSKRGGTPEAVPSPQDAGIPEPSRMAQAAHSAAVEAAQDAQRRREARSRRMATDAPCAGEGRAKASSARQDAEMMKEGIWLLLLAMARAGAHGEVRNLVRGRPTAWTWAYRRHGRSTGLFRFLPSLDGAIRRPGVRLWRLWEQAQAAVISGDLKYPVRKSGARQHTVPQEMESPLPQIG